MRRMMLAVTLAALLACTGCDSTSGSAQSGGSENGTYGKVKVGVPF